SYRPLPAILSFPTRRSSDLIRPALGVRGHDAANIFKRPFAEAFLKRRHRLRREREQTLRDIRAVRRQRAPRRVDPGRKMRQIRQDRKSTRLNSSHVKISYAV